jgi:predicted dinucleotide-binding enzyme
LKGTGRRFRYPLPLTLNPKKHHMTIGIIGSGAIGTAFARTLARAGIEATISNSRGPDSLKELVGELGPSIKAGTRDVAARGDIVFIAVNWTKLPAALAGLRVVAITAPQRDRQILS